LAKKIELDRHKIAEASKKQKKEEGKKYSYVCNCFCYHTTSPSLLRARRGGFFVQACNLMPVESKLFTNNR